MSKVGQSLQAFRIGVASHDRENPEHPPANGIGLSHFDMERLGFEEGEELWSGVIVQTDGGQSGMFRVLCDFESHEPEAREAEVTKAIGVTA